MQTFSEFARAHGVLVPDLYASDRIRRCATTTHERSKNGAYFWDGQRGWVMAWDGDGETYWYGGEYKPWTEEEKRAWGRERNQERQARDAKYAQAAARAQALIRASTSASHGYLQLKGFPEARELVQADESLLIPMRSHADNRLQGVQNVSWDDATRRWTKKMLTGMRAKGAVMRLGSPRASETILCEGYATGLSIQAALDRFKLNAAVLVCFSDSNMRYVADFIGGVRYAFADNDASQAGERAAQLAGLPYCMSDQVGEDANDLHVRAGLLQVCKKLMGVRSEALRR